MNYLVYRTSYYICVGRELFSLIYGCNKRLIVLLSASVLLYTSRTTRALPRKNGKTRARKTRFYSHLQIQKGLFFSRFVLCERSLLINDTHAGGVKISYSITEPNSVFYMQINEGNTTTKNDKKGSTITFPFMNHSIL